MQKIFVHLHPDFADELQDIFNVWNNSQQQINFIGIIPQKSLEFQLLQAGEVPVEDGIQIATDMRSQSQGNYQDIIIIFTEKRIFTDKYYQLFFGGSWREIVVSLDFVRKLFSANNETNKIFRVILNIILNAVFQCFGYTTHNETRGCLLDFCNHMPDILKGVDGGPKLCSEDLNIVKKRQQEFLLDLINVTASYPDLTKIDKKVSARINGFNDPEIIQSEENVTIDFGIVIALKEEFDILFPLIKGRFTTFYSKENKKNFYLFKSDNISSSNCVATFIGDMGLESALQITEWLINNFHPKTIANIGIAASLDPDVLLGDIVIGEQIENYLHNARIEDWGKSGFRFKLSNESFACTQEYIEHITNFCFTSETLYQKWVDSCKKQQSELLNDNNKGLSTDFFHEIPRVMPGPIASGPILCRSKNFKKILKDHNRKFLALEMESGGVLKSVGSHGMNSLVIRGISDFGEGNKEELDKFNDGAIRKYAMINSLTLFFALLDKLDSGN